MPLNRFTLTLKPELRIGKRKQKELYEYHEDH